MFYAKLAFSNLRKNRRVYIPFIFSMVFLMIVNVVMQVLVTNPGMDQLPRAQAAIELFRFGSYVIVFFSVIFSLYTNNFLLKQRKKELGLYNILGMGKRELTHIMFWESLFSFLIVTTLGIIFGSIFARFCFLVMRRILGIGEAFHFEIHLTTVAFLFLFFLFIFGCFFLLNVFHLRTVNPIDLFRGAQHGEKEPKMNWLTGLSGVLCIGLGYYFSVTIQSPLAALNQFLLAILLVIFGTYCLFSASSLMILKLLKRNEKYYYHPKHFFSISSMMYRLKQNAMGLASISILCTMVLVTISTTASLYFGIEGLVKNRNPYDISVTVSQNETEIFNGLHSLAQSNQLSVTKADIMHTSKGLVMLRKDQHFFPFVKGKDNMKAMQSLSMIALMDRLEYERLTGEKIKLNANEVYLFEMGGKYSPDSLVLGNTHLRITKKLDETPLFPKSQGIDSFLFIMNSQDEISTLIRSMFSQEDFSEMSQPEATIFLNVKGSQEQKMAFANQSFAYVDSLGLRNTFSSKEIDREDSRSFMGGFLFLGVIFGLTFTLATATIIYYKQLSEGNQDQYRYDIMQQVGMSHSEVKSTINSQILMVFFFPIGLAALHLFFAVPAIRKLLLMFGLSDFRLILIISTLTVIFFFLIYLAVYLLTSKVYYRIVERRPGSFRAF